MTLDGMGAFDMDFAVAKPRAGQLPIFNIIKQINPLTPFSQLDSQTVSDFASLGSSIKNFIQSAIIYWGLNSNPQIQLVLSPPAEQIFSFIDFPGFSKNSVIGVRFRKEQLFAQGTPWVYGVVQYVVPYFDTKVKSVQIDGYGILFEAQRRQNSRNFKNMSLKNIASAIVKKYGLGFTTKGPVKDSNIFEPEQNIDDFTYLNIIASKLDANWYIEESDVVFISNDYMYSQTPSANLLYGAMPAINTNNYFPITEFYPEINALVFEGGSERLTARGIDLDTGKVVEKIFEPKKPRLGSLALTSDQFRSDSGVTINAKVLKPSPKFVNAMESGVFVPYHSRSDELLTYQYHVEKKDLCIRATVKTVGLPGLTPGAVVNVQGVGEILSGNYLIDDLEHRMEKNVGFVTIIRLTRNALGQISSAASFKQNLNVAAGKVIGSVKSFAQKVTGI
jgi:hypothetical protein